MKKEIEKINEARREASRIETMAAIEFGKALNEWRVKKAWSLRKLGQMTGFSAAYLSDVERNNRGASADLLEKLSKI